MFLVRNANAPNRDEVEQKITELQKLIDQQKRTENLPTGQIRPPGSTTPASAHDRSIDGDDAARLVRDADNI